MAPTQGKNNNKNLNDSSKHTTQTITSMNLTVKRQYERALEKAARNPLLFEREIQKIQTGSKKIQPNVPKPTITKRKLPEKELQSENDQSETEKWQKPRKTRRQRRDTSPAISITSENSFNSLSDIETKEIPDNENIEEEDQVENKEPRNVNNKKQSEKQPKKERPPPIYIPEFTDIERIIDIVDKMNLEKDYTVNEVGGTSIVIYPQSLKDQKLMKEKLQEEQDIKYFTYTPDEEKPINVIMKGIKGN